MARKGGSRKKSTSSSSHGKTCQQRKVAKVMGEFKRKTLKSGSGKIVKSRDQAVAIAMSEAREHC